MLLPPTQAHAERTIFLPVIHKIDPPGPPKPFGVEMSPGRISNTTLQQRTTELGPRWLRLKSIHWRNVQPQESLPVEQWKWEELATFEAEVLKANELGLTPIAIVFQNPDWATEAYENPFTGEMEHAPCGAIKSEYLDEFATFMEEVVKRYSVDPYNVHYWEFGNEPDVDPRINAPSEDATVNLQEHFGCWGSREDEYYGGRHYGEMLKTVAPAIRAVDPDAKIMIGGILLDSPETTDPSKGNPELFLKGILEAGAASSFDILPFHAYPYYDWANGGSQYDSDLNNENWASRGGVTLGKISYIKQMLSDYGVTKPLFLDEAAMLLYLGAGSPGYSDDEIPEDFLNAQADHVVRQLARSLSQGVEAYCWYTIHKSSWNYSGLLNGNYTPRPVYTAYQHFIVRTGNVTSYNATTVDYGSGVEAYRFPTRSGSVDVLWSQDATADAVTIPTSNFVAAYDRTGAAISADTSGDQVSLSATISPIYVVRK